MMWIMKKIFQGLSVFFCFLCADGAGADDGAVWSVTSGCGVQASFEGIRLETDGRVEQNKLYFKLKFPYDLYKPPHIVLLKEDVHFISVDGVGKSFGFSIDYHPEAIAKLLLHDNAFILSYSPHAYYKKSGEKVLPQEVFKHMLPTAELPYLVAKGAEKCL